MLCRRIIPCLDLRNGRVVKGVRFSSLRDAGCPKERSSFYEKSGADEIVLLDISATDEGRSLHWQTIQAVRSCVSIPLTTGGGIRCADDAFRALQAGADKVSLNSAAVANPRIIAEVATRFGSQCAVVAIDARKVGVSQWEVLVRSGKDRTGRDVLSWAGEACALGAGELLITSWDRDGTGLGYDLELLCALRQQIPVPIIASGGAATPEHLHQALNAGADAVLAASIFHDNTYSVSEVKTYLAQAGVSIRI